VFKPSTDSGSLLVSTEKKNFFGFEFRLLWGRRQKWGCFAFFVQLYPALGANPMSHFWLKIVGNLGYHPSL